METHNAKIQKAASLLLLSLLCSFAVAKQAMPGCCRQKNCSCRILELLHGIGNHAAGILTIGKRNDVMATKAYQNRLYRLLHGSSNQAAGILTMGKRADEMSVEHQENIPQNQQALTSYAAGSDLVKGCLTPLEKDSASCQKRSSAESILRDM